MGSVFQTHFPHRKFPRIEGHAPDSGIHQNHQSIDNKRPNSLA
jgi:hypothetical protein